jgi:outer membrane protein assembly factor BamB
MTSGPAVSAGLVFVGSLHHLTAFPVDCVGSCRPVWDGVIHDPDGIVHQAVVADGVVYAGTGGGHLYAFPVECEGRCQPLWVSQRQRTSLRVLQVADGVVYADTEEFWGSATPDAPSYPMAYAFPVDCSRRCRPLWTTRLALTSGAVSLTAHAGMVYVAGSTGRGEGTLSAYRAACGIGDSCRSWTTSLSGNAADLLIVDDTLVVTIPDADQVRAYPLLCSDGCGPLWSATVPGVGGRPVGANGLVYVPSATGVAAIPLGCGTGGASCHPTQVTSHQAAGMAVGDGRLLVRSSNGQVYAFTLPAPIDARSADRGVDVRLALALVVAVLTVGSIAFVRSRRRVS